MNKVRVKILSGLLAVVVLGIAIASVWILFIKDDTTKNTSDDVGVVVSQPVSYYIDVAVENNDGIKNFQLKANADESLFETLKRYNSENSEFKLEYTQYDFGAFVTSLSGITPDATSEFFSLKINGVDSMVGVSDYKSKSGDKIAFVLTKFN